MLLKRLEEQFRLQLKAVIEEESVESKKTVCNGYG